MFSRFSTFYILMASKMNGSWIQRFKLLFVTEAKLFCHLLLTETTIHSLTGLRWNILWNLTLQ